MANKGGAKIITKEIKKDTIDKDNINACYEVGQWGALPRDVTRETVLLLRLINSQRAKEREAKI
jgi:hypothetical protein